MIRAMRRSAATSTTSSREPSSLRSARSTRSSTRTAPRRNRTASVIFSRRSLGLSSIPRASRRTTEPFDDPGRAPPLSHTDSAMTGGSVSGPRTFDPLALIRRIPATVRSFGYVKTARSLAVFSRFERFWLELRGTIVVLIVDDEVYHPHHTHTSQRSKENVIAGVFAVHKCHVIRSRGAKSAVIRLIKPGHSQNIWLRFDDESECDIWEKALIGAASQRSVGISDFEFVSPIGKGASGKVFLVTDRKTGEKLALKVIDKAKVFESRSGFRHALDERLALEMVDGHPFFSRLRYAFQTRAYFYLAIDFYDGGDLYQYLRTHQGRLRESQVRNVAAEVSLALEHLHKLGFVYRDLKPENVLLDSGGHVRLADFGLCKLIPNRALTNTICGTHTYAAPEMLAVRNYGKSIDLWAFGVFVYHILRGRTPYEARDLDQVIANMNNRRIRFSSNTSPELVSMIKKLLDWNPETRLGCGIAGMVEVRGHSFFAGVDWRRVYTKEHDEGGLFAKAKRSNPLASPERLKRSIRDTVPPPPPPSPAPHAQPQRVGARAGDKKDESPSSRGTREKSGGSGDSGKGFSDAKSSATDQGSPIGSKGSEKSSPIAAARAGASTGTESDEVENTNRMAARAKRLFRPKSLGHLSGNRASSTTSNLKLPRVASEQEQNTNISLREKMAAAAEQDDLRNFDMSEWGKISVDNDHDDPNYGDSSLWPISKARRRLVEDERVIAGFSYCSSSKPFVVPDNL